MWQLESGTQENAPAPQGLGKARLDSHPQRVAGEGVGHVLRPSAAAEARAAQFGQIGAAVLRATQLICTEHEGPQPATLARPARGFPHANRHNGSIGELSVNLPSLEHLQGKQSTEFIHDGPSHSLFPSPQLNVP